MHTVETFKALADPVRLRLFALLTQYDELCVCHLTEALALPQSTVSRHLSVLRYAGITTTRREGKWMYYQLNHGVPQQLIDLLQYAPDIQQQTQQDLIRLKEAHVL